MSSGRVVQYGRRSKHRLNPSPSPEPSPKRKKVSNGPADVEQLHASSDVGAQSTPEKDASRTPTRTYSSRAKAVTPDEDGKTLVLTRPNTPEPSPSSSTAGRRLIRTPSAKPKDLSGIFAPLPRLPASPSRSPGKSIAKRMLVRSRTEPSLPSSVSPKTTLTAAVSLPIVSPSSLECDETRSSPPLPLSSPALSKPNVRTYSQSRSFLVALPAASTSHATLDRNYRVDQSVVKSNDDLRESYSDLRTRWGVDNSEDDPYHVPGITNELMSMTELRSKGESRRFLDEVGYLFEGLEEPGMSSGVKRSSAIEIVLKMCDAEFVRKAKAADFIGRAWDAMRLAGAGDGDKVLDPCLAFFVALVVRNRRDVDDLARRDSFFVTMIRLLQTSKEKDGLLSLEEPVARKLGLSKAERVALTGLRNIIMTKSELFPSASMPSTRLLASFSLSCLIRVPLPELLLRPLLTTLLTELAFVLPQTDGQLPSILLPPPVASAVPDLVHTDYCLKILDVFVLGLWRRDFGYDCLEVEKEVLGTGLVALCASAAVLESESEWRHIARQCIESSFRVLINLSHSNTEWCKLLLRDPLTLSTVIPQIFPTPHGVMKREDDAEGGDNDEETRALDRQCLALGLLTNIVFGTDEARDSIRDLRLDPSCPRGRRCVNSCRCTRRSNAIECLVHLFVQTGTKNESDRISDDLSFFQSHLAAFLCLLTTDNPANQHIIWELLPDAVSRDKFSISVHQFLDFYANLGDSGEEALSVRDAMGRHVMLALRALEI